MKKGCYFVSSIVLKQTDELKKGETKTNQSPEKEKVNQAEVKTKPNPEAINTEKTKKIIADGSHFC